MLFWHGKEKLRSQFNCLFRLGIVHSEDVFDNESQRLSNFEDAKQWLCISPNYGFIWEKLQDIPLLQGSLPLKTNFAPWVDWWLEDGTRCREDPSLCADREAEPPGFWTGRTRSTH